MSSWFSVGLICCILTVCLGAVTHYTQPEDPESVDSKYDRLKGKLNVKEAVLNHPEINFQLLESGETIQEPHGLAIDDFEEIPEAAYVDKIDPNMLPKAPSRVEKTGMQKMFFQTTKFFGDMMPQIPKSIFKYFKDPEEAVYITPSLNPEIHGPVQETVYEAIYKPVPTTHEHHVESKQENP